MADKEQFLDIYKKNITRDGADKLLDFLENKSDFFTAPASTRRHSAYEGGLAKHSIGAYTPLSAASTSTYPRPRAPTKTTAEHFGFHPERASRATKAPPEGGAWGGVRSAKRRKP